MRLRHAYYHLAKMLPAAKVLVGSAGGSELEHAVDDGLELAHRYRLVHRLEHVAAADLYAAHGGALGEERSGIYRRLAGKVADGADVAAIADGGDRPCDRSRASDLHYDVRPAPAGQFAHPRVPLGQCPVVDHVGYPELAEA